MEEKDQVHYCSFGGRLDRHNLLASFLRLDLGNTCGCLGQSEVNEVISVNHDP